MNHFVAISRGRDAGSISPNSDDGRPVLSYTPSRFDRKHIIAGLIGIAKLCYIQGAVELIPFVPNTPPFISRKVVQNRSLQGSEFTEWHSCLEKNDLNPSRSFFACSHHMGSCRMGANSSEGVVDDRGEVWETEDLYIADASVFPSASGVNPMITTMANADRIAR
jgi:choline dehydrogenase-like flavoprotein